jgi:AmmeMemoRadiSam system protein A/AmmeMemoRadiSam system protein B
MSTDSFLVFTGIAPHPPIMVPEVGGEAIVEVRKSIDAMAEFTERVITSGAQTVILISPHAPLEVESFVAYNGPTVYGDFSRFRAPDCQFTTSVDDELLTRITAEARKESIDITRLGERVLDHGVAVPLYFLIENGWQGSIVALGYSFLSNDDHRRFGSCIKRAVDGIGKPVAFVASGDLSHRLKPEAPAGYNPNAHVFDEEVVDAIQSAAPNRIVEIDHQLRKLAGECGYRSMLVAIGASEGMRHECEVISYEAPFGVGYMVAQLTNVASQLPEEDGSLPALAREAVETFVTTGTMLKPPAESSGILAERAPCFVSLKTSDGELRGCIGTIEPMKTTLAAELIANAISAATRDPRFPPVSQDELADLRYSVDVLLPAEPATIEQLDPRVFGVIVEDESGERRGLLLPDIAGVDDANQQIEIAARKAGIPPGRPIRIWRFKVERYGE